MPRQLLPGHGGDGDIATTNGENMLFTTTAGIWDYLCKAFGICN